VPPSSSRFFSRGGWFLSFLQTHIDGAGDPLIHGKLRLPRLEHIGRKALEQAQGIPREDTHAHQLVKLTGFRSVYIGDRAPLSGSQLGQGGDNFLRLFLTLIAAPAGRYRFAMRTELGMSQEGADILLQPPIQQMLKFAGGVMHHHRIFGVQDIHQQALG
jgi:hypothetical protein